MRQYWQCTKCAAMRKVKPEIALHYSGPKLCEGTWEPVEMHPMGTADEIAALRLMRDIINRGRP